MHATNARTAQRGPPGQGKLRRMTRLLLGFLASVAVSCSGDGQQSLGSGGVPSGTGGSANTGGRSAPDSDSGGSGSGGQGHDSTGGVGGAGAAPAGGGGSSAGGATGSGGSPPAPGGTFVLRWEDTFDTLDSARWEAMTHSWDGNLAQFGAANATVSDGLLSVGLTAVDGAEKPYSGVELRSTETITFGKVEASVRFARGSAVVSSLVLIYTPWPPDDWNELDIEFLGKNTDQIQFNHMVNVPPADPATQHLQFPELATLAFDPAADFHTYAIEWEPGEARFLVDGELSHTATEEMQRMVLPQNILLTIWASDAPAWAGPTDETTAPTAVSYDWIRVYDYVPPT
jgi:endo-1,3-1,4-beta-glycanase ExoK